MILLLNANGITPASYKTVLTVPAGRETCLNVYVVTSASQWPCASHDFVRRRERGIYVFSVSLLR